MSKFPIPPPPWILIFLDIIYKYCTISINSSRGVTCDQQEIFTNQKFQSTT